MFLAILLSATMSVQPEALEMIKLFDAAGDAAMFAHAARLAPLEESNHEIRVWWEGALGVAGWVVAPSEIRVYSHTDNDRELRLKSTIQSRKAGELLSALSELAAFDGKPIVCSGVRDGGHFVIEGFASGRHFFVWAGNPSFCKVAGAERVTKAFAHLRKIAPVAP